MNAKNEMNEKMKWNEKNDDRSYESYYVNLLWSNYGFIIIISSFILAVLSILHQNMSPKIKIQEKCFSGWATVPGDSQTVPGDSPLAT